MSDREELRALAERVEALSGPCRETDALIWLAVTPGATRQATVILDNDVRKGWTIDETRELGGRLITVPAYTASIDAAMTLAPDECPSRCVGTTDDGRGYAELARDDGHMMAQDPDEWWSQGNAATPALALTSAALRARSQATSQ